LSLIGIAGCGIKGPLEPPPEASAGSGETGAGTPGTKQEDSSHDPFVLDRILR
ncbi:MAG: LPS translocon maturation chaperone LptM, partial [Desulfobulbia bacterium]